MDGGGEKMCGSVLKEKLRSICCRNGWCYGLFWRFDQRNPMLLAVEDAYYEEQMGTLVQNMLDRVHMLGEGIVGLAAFTGKDQWILPDANSEGWTSTSSDGTRDLFQDDSEVHSQLSFGIKTIAVISVESQGIIQFGSTEKIMKRLEFLDETKELFKGMENFKGFTSKASSPSSLSCENYDLDDWFDSLCNGNITPMLGSNSNMLMEMVYPSISSTQSSCITSDVHQGRLSPLCTDSSYPMDEQQTVFHETQVMLSSSPNAHLLHLSSQSASYMDMSVNQTPCISTQSNEGSILTSTESQFTSEFIVQDSSHISTTNANAPPYCGNINLNSHADSRFTPWHLTGAHASSGELSEKETSIQRFSREFKLDDLTTKLSNPNEVDCIFEMLPPSPEHSTSGMATIINENPVQSGRGASELSGLIGEQSLDPSSRQPANFFESSITDIHACREGLGMGFSCANSGNCLEDLIRPALSVVHMPTVNTGVSEYISELDVGSTAGSRKGLFSELGLEELIDSINTSNSAKKSSLDDQLYTSKRRKMEHPSVNCNLGQSAKVSFPGGSMRMQHVHTLDKKVDPFPKQESILKSEVSLWIDDSYSANNGIAGPAKTKKLEEPAKATRKRARPGENTRPRPRDRQQIQDRIKELKEIIPDGGKCSIDALLDRTIKHMLFLQSVTKYADKLKQADEPKLISQENSLLLKNKKKGGGGITWALEVADETAICPVVVEDLNPPGLMLVEMLCDDHGFFLEIADVIRGFGLNLVKGVMETQEDKIWARFVVEAKVRITRTEILWSLVELLNRMGTSGMDPTNQPSNSTNTDMAVLNSYRPPALPLPHQLDRDRPMIDLISKDL